MTKQLLLSGNTVAIIPVDEVRGKLLVPQTANRVHELAKIVAVGKKVKTDLAVGDIVFFQANAMMSAYHTVKVDDKVVLIIHHDDIIAKLSEPVVSIDTFKVHGAWVLCRADVEQKSIVIPDTVEDINSIPYPHFFVLQVGGQANLDTSGNLLPDDEAINVCDEVIVDKARTTIISLGDTKRVAYINRSFIFGKLQ